MMDRINLYAQYLEMGKDDKPFPIKQMILILLITSLILVGFIFSTAKIKNNRLLRQERELRAFVEDQDILKKYELSQINETMLNERNELYTKITGVNSILEEKRQLNPDLFEQISSSLPYGVSLLSLDFSDGKVVIKYESKTIEGPSLFAQKLKNQSLIKKLDYQGFSKETDHEEIEEQTVEEEFAEKLDAEKELIIEKETITKKEESFVYSGSMELILEGGY